MGWMTKKTKKAIKAGTGSYKSAAGSRTHTKGWLSGLGGTRYSPRSVKSRSEDKPSPGPGKSAFSKGGRFRPQHD
jgi:hypothetical protein